VAPLEQVGGEGVAEGVAGDAFGHPGGLCCARDGTLNVRLMVVMASLAAIFSLPSLRGREDPLPAPVTCGRGKLAVQRFRQPHPTEAAGQIFLVQNSGVGELLVNLCHGRCRQHGYPVVLPFRVTHGHLPPLEVDILDAPRLRCLRRTKV